MNIGKRIKELRGERPVQECADRVGVTRSAWYQWEAKEDQQSLKHENLAALAKLFDMTVDEFLNPSATAGHRANDQRAEYVLDDSGMYNVRWYDEVKLSAGSGIENGHHSPSIVQVPRWMIPADVDPANVVLVAIEGDSMYPLLKDGECALVNRAERRLREGKIFAFNDGGHQRVKKFVKRVGGGWLMKSENMEYSREDQVIAPDEFEKFDIIGRVFKGISTL